MPETIEADISGLGVGEHLTAADLTLPHGIALAIEPTTILVSVEASRIEAEAAEAAPAPPAAEVPTVAESAPENE